MFEFAEAYAREYASSSNAALLEANQGVRRQLQKVVDQVTALEGQLREARECVQALSVTNQENAKMHQAETDADNRDWKQIADELHCESSREAILKSTRTQKAEVERLQEALRDAIGAKDGWRIRAGKVLDDPKV